MALRHLEERFVGVLLADVEVDDVAVAQLALVRLEEVEGGQTGSDVVVRLLAQRQQRRHVRPDRLLPGDGHQPLRQPVINIQLNSIQFNSIQDFNGDF